MYANHYCKQEAVFYLTLFRKYTITAIKKQTMATAKPLFKCLPLFLIPGLLSLSVIITAQTRQASYYNMLHWRMIGPHRGGRTVGAAGVPQQPNVFYIGVNNGGVWKTTDFGRTWQPIFDEQSTGSVGDIAVAASNPDV